jgi:tRNA 2-selenouridine synthase
LIKIAKRLGGLTLTEALEALDAGNLAKVAEISLKYYDKAYRFSLEKRNRSIAQMVETTGLNVEEIAQIICKIKR